MYFNESRTTDFRSVRNEPSATRRPDRLVRSERAKSSRILVDNLDFKVTDADLNELFGTVGPLERCSIFYTKEGRSTGSGEVAFCRPSDASRAFHLYNGRTLDGREMRMKFIDLEDPSLSNVAKGNDTRSVFERVGGKGAVGGVHPRPEGVGRRNDAATRRSEVGRSTTRIERLRQPPKGRAFRRRLNLGVATRKMQKEETEAHGEKKVGEASKPERRKTKTAQVVTKEQLDQDIDQYMAEVN